MILFNFCAFIDQQSIKKAASTVQGERRERENEKEREKRRERERNLFARNA